MQTFLWTIRFKLQSLAVNEDGQDLVEYALVIVLVSIAAVASLTSLDHKITGVFSAIGADL
jgi:pilus assembly protein Flp/PilA